MSTLPPDSPGLAEADLDIATAAIGLELAIRDLYDAARANDDSGLWALLREQHESYATRLAGVAGVSANTRDDEFFSEFEGPIGENAMSAALAIENRAAATHTSLVGNTTENPLASAMAAIAIMESRHALAVGVTDPTVDNTDFDTLFGNPDLEA